MNGEGRPYEDSNAGSFLPMSEVASWALAWLQENWLSKLALPLLFTLMRIMLFFLVSVVAYALFYRWMVPVALAREPVYFDYSQTPPIARVNLLTAEKQWEYLRSDSVDASGGDGAQRLASRDASAAKQSRFLRSDFRCVNRACV